MGCGWSACCTSRRREAARDVAVVLLSPGVKTRVAPHRLYNKMAAALTAQGFTVLRFDFYGLGDAEGDVPLRLLRDLYGSVALGRYVNDTKDALDWLARTHGYTRVSSPAASAAARSRRC